MFFLSLSLDESSDESKSDSQSGEEKREAKVRYLFVAIIFFIVISSACAVL